MWKYLVVASLAAVPTGPAFAQRRDDAASALNSPDVLRWAATARPRRSIDGPKVPGGKALRIQAEKDTNTWNAAVNTRSSWPVKAGDPLVLAFWARLASGGNGATSVTLPWVTVSLGSAPWTPVFGGPVTIGHDWKIIEVRGTADKDYPPGTLSAGIQVATGKQTIDFGPLYVAKASGGAQVQPVSAPAAPSALAALDPDTIASKIVNDPGAPEVRGVKAQLVDDPKVTGGKAMRVQIPRKGQNAWIFRSTARLRSRSRPAIPCSSCFRRGSSRVRTARPPPPSRGMPSA